MHDHDEPIERAVDVAYDAWLATGASSSMPGYFEARAAIDAASRPPRDFRIALCLAHQAVLLDGTRWASLYTALTALLRLAEPGLDIEGMLNFDCLRRTDL